MADLRRRLTYRNEIDVFFEKVNRLPKKERLLVQLYFRDGHSLTDIALLCGVQPRTISRRIKCIVRKVAG